MCPQEVTVASEGAGGWRIPGVLRGRWAVVTLLALFTAAFLPARAYGRVFLLHDKGLDRHGWRDEAPHLYRMDLEENDVVVLGRYRTHYGETDSGPKRHEGDRRTPEGKYSITDIRRRARGEQKSFGPWSLRLSYPNRYDRQRWNPGDGILLHGGHDSITNGCIRVLDEGYSRFGERNITELARVTDWGTPIISASHVPHWLKGRKDKSLGRAAARFYRTILGRDLSNDAVIEEVRDYGRGGSTPVSAAVPSRRLPNSPLASPPPTNSSGVTAAASSEYHGSTSSDYVAAKVLDGRNDTAWCEGVSGNGKGQWIEIDLGRQNSIAGFQILNGYDKRGRFDRWKANGRMAKVEITTDTGKSYTVNLANDRSVHTWTFDEAIRARKLRFTIESVYSGTMFLDTCVSKLEVVYGYGGS